MSWHSMWRPLAPIDTVAAGDTFCWALAVGSGLERRAKFGRSRALGERGGGVVRDGARRVALDSGARRNRKTAAIFLSYLMPNPLLSACYADPEIHFYEGKFWIYPTTSMDYEKQT